LGLAVPLVVSVSTSLSAKNGVLIRDRASFERVRKIDKIVFDKTGTLTKGEFRVTDVISFEDYEEDRILRISSSLESESEHSIALGIVKTAEEKQIKVQSPDEFEAIPGKGIRGYVDGSEYFVVSPAYLEENGIKYNQELIEPLHNEGKTVVFLLQKDDALGALALADAIRDESRSAIKDLRDRGIQTVMLTGDNKVVAKHVAKELDIDEFYAEVLPDQKSKVIKELQKDGKFVAMVGDGINDAPALATADVGIAIGAGTDVALESADIILVKDNPQNIIDAINLSENTYNKMKQNLAWATGYNALAIPLAAGLLYNIGIILSPAVGAALMSLSTVIVAINSRFLKL
jgi:Cu2+-exporting ATPase